MKNDDKETQQLCLVTLLTEPFKERCDCPENPFSGTPESDLHPSKKLRTPETIAVSGGFLVHPTRFGCIFAAQKLRLRRGGTRRPTVHRTVGFIVRIAYSRAPIKKHRPEGGVSLLVHPTRFERATYRVGVCHSIQLSYGCIFTAVIIADFFPKVKSENGQLLENFPRAADSLQVTAFLG